MNPDGSALNRGAIRALSRLTFSLAIPLAMQNLIAFAVNMMDTLMLGQLGKIPLSASAQANQLFFIVTLAVGGVVGGANVLTAQAWGKRDVATIHRVLAYAYRTALAIALLATLAAVVFPVPVMRLFSPDDAVVRAGADYLRIVGFSYLFYTLTTVTTGALQAVHTVHIAMLGSAAAMLINIVLNWALIFGRMGFPALGISGAAIATLIARLCEFTIVLFYVYGKEDKLRLRVKKLLAVDKTLARRFFAISLPVIANELFWALGEAALAVLMGRMGTEMVAANSICSVAGQFASIFCRGVTAAACVIVANTVGAEKNDELAIQTRYFQRLSLLLGIVAGAIILIVRPLMLRMYNVDTLTLHYASQIMLIEAGIQVFRYYQLMNMMGILRGGGDVHFAMANDLIFLWGFTVPAGFLAGLVLHWPVAVVYAIIKFDQIIKVVSSALRLRNDKWVHNTVQKED